MKKTTKIAFNKFFYSSLCFVMLFLLSNACLFAQDESSIQQHFTTYHFNNYQEKVFLHTDKSVYATGEILWFKVYITNASTNDLSSLSTICYVELFGEDKKPLLQAKVDIDSGNGAGSFVIPSFVHTGNYLIRGYTNWMKNFDPSFYFETPISIVNINKKGPATDTVTKGTYSIQFFPEGGNMVYGLANTIAFKITDNNGKGVQGKGCVINEKQETVVGFETERFGMGTFTFNPVAGNKYHAIIQVNNKTISHDLPEIYNSGWAMHVTDEGNVLKVNVATNVITEHNVFIFAQTRNSIKFAKKQPLVNGTATVNINKSDLGEGISQLTIFNEEKQPVSERLYFKRPESVLQVKLNDVQQEYGTRKKVDINILTSDTNGHGLNAGMSVAVYLADSLQPVQDINILNYLWLSSDLKGTIESPQYYFENATAETAKAADNLMLTQGWRRFKWEEVLKDAGPSFTFLPEHEGHVVTGRISPKISGLPDTGIHVYLSVPGKNFRFAQTVSSASGYIKFNVQKFYGSHEIIAQAGLADSNYRIVIDNPFSEIYSQAKIQPLSLQTSQAGSILLRSIGAQAENSYQPEKEENFALPVSYDTTGFTGVPSKTYYLDNYTRFPTMEEVMREYVKEVHVRNRQKNFHYEVFNAPDISYFSAEPLVLIDGVPVFNVNKIIELDPLKIKKVDVVTNRFFAGGHQYDGIVSYSTYNDDLDGYQLDPNSVVVEYEGLQFKREFYLPQYETPGQASGRIPDYRNVLYWSPDVYTTNGKQDVSFYTSDIPGKYIVVVQGISSTSLVGYAAATFTVVPGSK
jgi:hypothetical protein